MKHPHNIFLGRQETTEEVTFQEDSTQIQYTIDFILTSHYQHEVQDTIIT